ncbi:SubName: Full=Uncharacterized protein {ECO:0000313/EMBL:CCA66768.1} [Serendipita indica DSM 11827]|uniref:Uncharacterized protein n=1 Tax=Serendipita indica (strain DSM 11827) TaxID=1109443 RepID=G4T5Z1_SERID|nr:SubName: Full=Uncharacterized protein {ECO:0000313/EMBL:CCA66768.1} [Serendipita indica DSM 11827]CCA66768.1 hypothetical protein PIIN_00448 [Serendipita indica DSM 11827]
MTLASALGLRRSPRNHRSHAANRNAGLKSALTNPNSTHAGRAQAKHELHMRGQSAHVPLMAKVKRALGMHQTPRHQRKVNNARARARRQAGTTRKTHRRRHY